jgi:bifunctional DNA-binding transcriptional regulator/antitoxin component of YhaV-PrlF toxin-antitoxin module
MANVVGQKGQVVIEKEIRDRLGVEPGWIALQRLTGNHIEVYFIPPGDTKSLKGSLAGHVRTSIPAGKAWQNAIDKAWKKESQRKTGMEKGS